MATNTAADVVMPQMGVSVSEGTITKWLKRPGDAVAMDEPLLEISTDKVDTEVPSPGEGIVQEILVQEGETVPVGTKLAVIGAGGAPAAAPPPAPAAAPAPVAEPAPAPTPPAPAPPPTAEALADEVPADGGGDGNGRTFVSPVVARIAAEHGVDVGGIHGTGRGGRVTKKDILSFIESGPPTQAPVASAAPVEAPAPTPEPAPAAPATAAPEPAREPQPAPGAAATEAVPAPGEQIEPMNAMRRGIAEHMRRSLDTSAHVTSAIEVDMARVVAARERLKAEYQQGYGINPTYLAFIANATVPTLRDWPLVNGELRGESIVTRQFVNLGIAVSLEEGKGLIVPVIRNAEGLNLLGMARAIQDVASRAREKKLLPDDVVGGTFTITNPGGFGTLLGTPIISQPQAAILGTYAVVKRPWVVQDENGADVIAIRPIMNLTLTYDHRLIDGAYAGQFLRDLRDRLEGWEDSAT
jgi:2-oxoglutarate dehydrogenase E2 component (dihydrolipoamide succinyltransferase)